MAKRMRKRSPAEKPQAQAQKFAPVPRVLAALTGPRHFDEVRHHEFAVEALCELAADAARVLEKGCDAASAEFAERFSGICMAASGLEVPADLHKLTHPVRASKMLGMCLSRVQEFTQRLAQSPSRAQWRDVREMVDAWLNSWGDDERARYARARFSTLTGLVPGQEPWVGYMYTSLIKCLSAVQA